MALAKSETSFTSAVAGDPMNAKGLFNISVEFTTGSGVGTVALQRSFDGGTTWRTVEQYTSDTEKVGEAPENIQYRLNCTAYTSGTIEGRISQDRI